MAELGDAGGPTRPNRQPTWPDRIRSSYFVRPRLHLLALSITQPTAQPSNAQRAPTPHATATLVKLKPPVLANLFVYMTAPAIARAADIGRCQLVFRCFVSCGVLMESNRDAA